MTERSWIVGFDGSSTATHAAEWAVTHAPGRADVVTLLQAVGPSNPIIVPPLGPPDPMMTSEVEDALRANLDRAAQALAVDADVTVDARLQVGEESTVLLDAADRADLLVVGTHGHSRFERLLLGSTSARCATHSTSPTVVVPRRLDAPLPHRAADVVVGVDGSANSVAALDWACGFAAPESRVTIVSVWEFTPSLFSGESFYFPDAIAHARNQFQQLLDTTRERYDGADFAIEGDFVQGRPRDELARRATDADLVVIGRSGYGSVGSVLLGSVSSWMLHHATGPTVVVPPDESGHTPTS